MKPLRRAGDGAAVRVVSACGLMVVAALLAGCGDRDDKPASQVAAKVNKEEISVHQINYVMQRQPGLKPEQAEERSRQILERLIDQELAVQRAQELELDRDPRAVQAIEAARREILARMYFERASEGAPAPTPDEIRSYYQSKPALFAQRRIYNLQEVAIDVPADSVSGLQQQLDKAGSAQAFLAQLQANNIRYTVSQVTRAAEQLPLELLDQVAALQPGQALLLPAPSGARALVVSGFRESPVGEAQARPVIEQFIANERRRQIVEQDLKAMREQARVEYVGKFAEAAPTADAAGQPAAAAVPAPAEHKGATAEAAAIQKGLQGLK